MVEEPYNMKEYPVEYNIFKNSNISKTEIWTRKELQDITLDNKRISDNYITVLLKCNGGKVMITNIYDEPGIESKRLNELKNLYKIKDEDKLLLAGNFNAKNAIWEGNSTDLRGEKTEWAATEGLQIENDRR